MSRKRRAKQYAYDLIQARIDDIVRNHDLQTCQHGPCQPSQAMNSSAEGISIQPAVNCMARCATSNLDPMATRTTCPPVRSISPTTHETIDITFEEDARWHGIHPFHATAQEFATLKALIPKGYRYDRAKQAEPVRMPPSQVPLDHPPGPHFVLRKRGNSAIPIVNPQGFPGAASPAAADAGITHPV